MHHGGNTMWNAYRRVRGIFNMASKKSNEQAILWLRSMAADKNSLDGINAELCLNIIFEQRERLEKLGVQFGQIKKQNDDLLKRVKNEANYSNKCVICTHPDSELSAACPFCELPIQLPF